MNILKDLILAECSSGNDEEIRINSFLSHQIMPNVIFSIANELAQRFSHDKITKILTIESSGIAIAVMLGYILKIPIVFAKKQITNIASGDDRIIIPVHSSAKCIDFDMVILKKYLSSKDRVLIIDDFLEEGDTAFGMVKIINRAHATLIGVGVAIEKGFLKGGQRLRSKGVRVESLLTIKSIGDEYIFI